MKDGGSKIAILNPPSSILNSLSLNFFILHSAFCILRFPMLLPHAPSL